MLYILYLNKSIAEIVDKSYYHSLFWILCIVMLVSIILILLLLLPKIVLYDNNSNVVIDNTGSKIVNHSFNYIKSLPKDTPSFIMKYMSSPQYSSPILDAALNSSLDWGKSASCVETTTELKRPMLSSISRNDSVMNAVYNGIKSASRETFSPFTPATYGELNKEIVNLTSNLASIEEECSSPDGKYSLLEKGLDQKLYLLNQKYKHLEAVYKIAADTPILQKDYDLVENYRSLTDDLNTLGKKLDDLSFRSLVD